MTILIYHKINKIIVMQLKIQNYKILLQIQSRLGIYQLTINFQIGWQKIKQFQQTYLKSIHRTYKQPKSNKIIKVIFNYKTIL